MYGFHTATVWASVTGMPGPLIAQVTASGEAIAVFTAVVVGMSGAIGVLFKMLLSEQVEHRKHISQLVAEQEQTIRTLNTNHEHTVQRMYEEGKADRKEYMVDMRTCWTMLAEIEEKRQQSEQRTINVLAHLERKRNTPS